MKSNKLKLAACIKIRNKEEEFSKVASILSKINPTSFRNTGLGQLKGLGVQGAVIGGLNHMAPGASEAAGKLLSGYIPTAGTEAAAAFNSNLKSNLYGTLARAGHTIMGVSSKEMARQAAIRQALLQGRLSVAELADNVTRYVPLAQHKNYFAQLERELGKDVMSRYRGAFIA